MALWRDFGVQMEINTLLWLKKNVIVVVFHATGDL